MTTYQTDVANASETDDAEDTMTTYWYQTDVVDDESEQHDTEVTTTTYQTGIVVADECVDTTRQWSELTNLKCHLIAVS